MSATFDQELVQAAIEARRSAYAPYSQFAVGAALRRANGRIVVGVNVENCSYGLTQCAERSAVCTAVAQQMRPGELVAVAVVAQANTMTAPCGACRQVLIEFAAPGAMVYLHNLTTAQTQALTLASLLPVAFGPEHLVP